MNIIRRLFFVCIAIASFTSAANAQVQYYYNPTIGGAGSWDTTGSTNWSTSPTGPTGTAWLNDGTAVANFGFGAGTVTLGSPISAYGINFTTDNYIINGSGANILTLTGTGVIDTSSSVNVNGARINAQIGGSVGLTKTGLGKLILGGANTYTGTTTVTGTYLDGIAQTSGSPFSNVPVTLNGGGIRLAGASGATTTTTVGDLTVSAPNNTNSGLSTVVVNNSGATGTTFALGNLVRGGAGSVLVITPQNATLGSGENVTFANGNALLTNGILPAWVVATPSGPATPAADFVGYGGAGAVAATYTSNNLATSSAGDVVYQNVGATMAGNVQAYALKTDVATNLGSNTLTLGSGAAQAGLILNNSGSITNGTINFGSLGAAEGMIYAQNGPTLGANGDTTTVNSSGLNVALMDGSGITVNAAINDGTAPSKLTITGVNPNGNVTLNGASNYTGGTTLNFNSDNGNLIVGSNSALGTGKVTYVPAAGSSGTLRLSPGGVGAITLANAFDLNGNLTINGTNALAFNGPIAFLNSVANSSRTLTTSASSGQVTLGNSATPSTITLGSNGNGTNLIFLTASGTTTVINDVMQDPTGGVGAVQYGKSGTPTIAGTIVIHSLNTYTGQTTMGGGNATADPGSTIQFDHDYNAGDPSGPFGKGGTIRFDNTINNFLQPIKRAGDPTDTATARVIANPITMNFGFTVSNAASDPSEGLTLTGPITMLASGRTVTNNFTNGTGGTLTLGASPNSTTWTMPTNASTSVQFSGAGKTIVNDTVQESIGTNTTSFNISGGSLNLAFNGTVTIGGGSTQSGASSTVTTNGTFTMGGAYTQSGASSTLTTNGTTTMGSFAQSGANSSFTVNGPLNTNANSTMSANFGTLVIGGAWNAGAGTFVVSSTAAGTGQPNAPNTVTFNAPRSGTGSVTFGGGSTTTPSTVNLNAQSTYSGGTTVNGPFTVINVGASTDGTPASFTKGPFGTGTITVNNGNNEHFRAVNTSQTIANAISLTTGIAIDSADPNDTKTLTFSGPMTLNSTQGRTISNGFKAPSPPNVAGNLGATMILGDFTTPSTITHGTSATSSLNIDYAAITGPIIINDVIQDKTASDHATAGFNPGGQQYAPIVLRGANTFTGNATVGGSGSTVLDGAILIGISSTGGTDGAPASGPFGRATLNLSDASGTLKLVPLGADRTIGNPISMNQVSKWEPRGE